MATSIVMLDCQKMFVECLKSYFTGAATQHSILENVCRAEDLFAVLEDASYDCLIMDLNVPDQDGMQVISKVKEEKPDMKVIVLSAYTDFKFVKDAMISGADGYVSKMSTMRELSYALQDVAVGSTYIGDGLRTSPAAPNSKKQKQHSQSGYEDGFTLKNKLTPREVEILELLTQGMKSRGIASKLFISDQTVGVHRKNIMKKLGIRNTAALIKFALENHLV